MRIIDNTAMSKDVDIDTSRPECGYCKNAVVKIAVKCTVCAKIFHPSCGKNKLKKCCEEPLTNEYAIKNNESTDSGSELKKPVILTSDSTNIEFLLKIISELEEKSSILAENNLLLKEKIVYLTSELTQKDSIIADLNKKRENSSQKNENKTKYAYASVVANQREQTSKESNKRSATGDPREHPLEIAQRNKMNEIIHLVTNSAQEGVLQQQHNLIERQQQNQNHITDFKNTENQTTVTESNHWREPHKKRKRTTKLRVGTGKTDENQKQIGFAGVEKKAWFFISRIKPHVTEETVANYIRGKPSFEDLAIEVKELAFKRKVNELKSFLVKVPFEKKDDLYNTEFWPENIRVNRFNIKVYEKTKSETSDFL